MKGPLLISCLLGTVLLCAATSAETVQRVSERIQWLGEASAVEERVHWLAQIEEMTREMDRQVLLDEKDVLTIASYLDDDSREVVHFSAVILGNIGSAAAAAVPALERSMARLEAEEDRMLLKPAQPFATEMYVALRKIDGRPIPHGMGRDE
jgi:hypothetical protein